MADEAVSVVALTKNTASGDILTVAAGGVEINAGNSALINWQGQTRSGFVTLYAASAATFQIVAGDEPPSESAGLGTTDAQTIPAGDCVVLGIEAGRFIDSGTDAGKSRISVAGNNVIVTAFQLGRWN